MADVNDVLTMLRPEGGFVVVGNSFDGAQFFECEPVTKKEFDDAAKKYDAWKAKQDTDKETAKATAEGKLAALGLTTDDLRALGL
jgi:hypothetical protein